MFVVSGHLLFAEHDGYSWGGVCDSDPKIHQSQVDLDFAPLSKTSGHTTSVFVQPNERHKVKAIPKWQSNKSRQSVYIAVCPSDGKVGHVCACLWLLDKKRVKMTRE